MFVKKDVSLSRLDINIEVSVAPKPSDIEPSTHTFSFLPDQEEDTK